jgi:hypothetical protein
VGNTLIASVAEFVGFVENAPPTRSSVTESPSDSLTKLEAIRTRY